MGAAGRVHRRLFEEYTGHHPGIPLISSKNASYKEGKWFSLWMRFISGDDGAFSPDYEPYKEGK